MPRDAIWFLTALVNTLGQTPWRLVDRNFAIADRHKRVGALALSGAEDKGAIGTAAAPRRPFQNANAPCTMFQHTMQYARFCRGICGLR